ncbi:MAG: hypothetical protein HY847_11915 [Betaproteobacteria bacterium]|nr:hypothetical protein [Betaproteobacteria bacterium]
MDFEEAIAKLTAIQQELSLEDRVVLEESVTALCEHTEQLTRANEKKKALMCRSSDLI